MHKIFFIKLLRCLVVTTISSVLCYSGAYATDTKATISKNTKLNSGNKENLKIKTKLSKNTTKNNIDKSNKDSTKVLASKAKDKDVVKNKSTKGQIATNSSVKLKSYDSANNLFAIRSANTSKHKRDLKSKPSQDDKSIIEVSAFDAINTSSPSTQGSSGNDIIEVSSANINSEDVFANNDLTVNAAHIDDSALNKKDNVPTSEWQARNKVEISPEEKALLEVSHQQRRVYARLNSIGIQIN